MSEQRDPPRWLEDTELGSELRRELGNYGAEAPSLERQSRMFAGLEHELGLSTGGARLTSKVASLSKIKLLFTSLALMAGAIGLFALWPHPARELPKKAASSASAAVTPELVLPSEESEPPSSLAPPTEQVVGAPGLPVAPPVVSHARGKARRAPRQSAQPALPAVATPPLALPSDDTSARNTRSDPVAELALLARARRALLTQPAHALEFTEQHARDYPQGTFGEEREVLAIESLYRIGLTGEAKQRAAAFEQHFPNSPQRAHLTRMMQTLAP